MLYTLLRFIITMALRIFYRKIIVAGQENIPRNVPLIVAGNHPNTFMDPILVAYSVPQHVYFLANGSLFRSRMISWFLGKLNLIPIYRKQDAAPADQKQMNDITFRNCYDFLANNGTLLVFPEGNSINERRLRPLKTGTARIALGAEHANNFALDVHILPVGVNYSNPTRFREEAQVKIGRSIAVRAFREAWQTDEIEAVRSLTATLESALKELIIVTRDSEEDDLARKIEKVYSHKLTSSGKPVVLDVELTRNIIRAISYYQNVNPVLIREVKETIDEYLATLASLRVNDYVLAKKQPIGYGKYLRYLLYVATGFPFYVTGLLFNYVPYIIPSRLANWISKDEEYRAPIMMTAGIFTFPLWYGLVTLAAWQLVPHWATVVSLLLIMPATGFHVLAYWKKLANLRTSLTYAQVLRKDKTIVEWLASQREEIIARLESARREYLEVQNETI
jgi:glycerol-3-phosphate O-acyltransferase / dihydroxyacetone phosphate acyltransferase